METDEIARAGMSAPFRYSYQTNFSGGKSAGSALRSNLGEPPVSRYARLGSVLAKARSSPPQFGDLATASLPEGDKVKHKNTGQSDVPARKSEASPVRVNPTAQLDTARVDERLSLALPANRISEKGPHITKAVTPRGRKVNRIGNDQNEATSILVWLACCKWKARPSNYKQVTRWH